MLSYLASHNSVVTIKGVEFHRTYKDGLSKRVKQADLLKGLTVALVANEVQRFAYFQSPVYFASWVLKYLKKESRVFEEFCLGERLRKPVLDIECEDVSVNREELECEVIDSLLAAFELKGVEIDIQKDLWIATSHRANKFSWRIVVDGWFHRDVYDARAFGELVKSGMREAWKNYIDIGIYSDKHRLRLVNNRKHDGSVYFELKEQFIAKEVLYTHRFPEEIESPEHKFIMETQAMCISWISGCKPLPVYGEPPQEREYQDVEIEASDVNEAINITKSRLGESWCYKYGGMVKGNCVILVRTRPAYCTVCKKEHESEHAFLVLSLVDTKEVEFHCRRADKNHIPPIIVGNLPHEPMATSIEEIKAILRLSQVEQKVDKEEHADKVVLEPPPPPIVRPASFRFPDAKPSGKLRIQAQEEQKLEEISTAFDRVFAQK